MLLPLEMEEGVICQRMWQPLDARKCKETHSSLVFRQEHALTTPCLEPSKTWVRFLIYTTRK